MTPLDLRQGSLTLAGQGGIVMQSTLTLLLNHSWHHIRLPKWSPNYFWNLCGPLLGLNLPRLNCTPHVWAFLRLKSVRLCVNRGRAGSCVPLEDSSHRRIAWKLGKRTTVGYWLRGFGSINFTDGIIFQALYQETILNELHARHTTWSNWALSDHGGPRMPAWSERGATVVIVLWPRVT